MAEYEQLGRTASLTIVNMVTLEKVEVSGLRISFKISKVPKQSNKGSVVIYNLAPRTRHIIETVADKSGEPQTHVELRVGYKKSTQKLIFRGRCEATSRYASPNWVTSLEGEDGKAQFMYNFEKKYNKGTNISTIVKDIADAAKIEKFSIEKMTSTLKKTRTFSGPPLKIIKTLQKTYNFAFDIQDEGAIIRANKYKLDSRSIITMDYARGLLGEPRTKGNLVVIDTLINPDIRPNSYVDLSSIKRPYLNGLYIIQRVDSTGDNYSGSWTMTVEMLLTKTPAKVATKGG